MRKSLFRAALMLEPNNPVDANAIAVYADGVGLVGYLNRDDAIDCAPIFPEVHKHGCNVGSCPAFLIGGEPGKPSGSRTSATCPFMVPPYFAEGQFHESRCTGCRA